MGTQTKSHRIVILGAGAAGLAVAARLLRLSPELDVALIDPAQFHYYQPGWTLVGGGVFTADQTRRPMIDLIPPGAKWFRQAVKAVEPQAQRIILADDTVVTYEYLVVCPGLRCAWERIEGLPQTLGKNGVSSNYRYDLAPYTWELIRNFHGGRALFTQPPMPIKCPGAPQKIAYLAADYFRQHDITANLTFCIAGDVLFGVKPFARALEPIARRYGIALEYRHNLMAVDGERRVATFQATAADGTPRQVTHEFDLLHVTPPQVTPDFLQNSEIVNADGFVEVDQYSLQHLHFGNIFSLGDAAGTANSKTAAAVRQQAPVVVRNLLAAIHGEAAAARYDGYGSCPLTTAYGKVMLAEFRYNGEVTPSFPLDPFKERRSMWWLKTRLLPFLYWQVMLKGWEIDVPHYKPRAWLQEAIAREA